MKLLTVYLNYLIGNLEKNFVASGCVAVEVVSPSRNPNFNVFLDGVAVSESSAASFRKSVDAYEDLKYKPIFAFILRQEAGIADTIDKYVARSYWIAPSNFVRSKYFVHREVF